MSKTIIKYMTINNVLYRIIECESRGYGDSKHISSNVEKVNEEDIEKILREHEKNGKEIPRKFYAANR